MRKNCTDNFVSWQLERVHDIERVHDMIQHGNYDYALELFREIQSTQAEYKEFETRLLFKIKHGQWPIHIK